MQLIFTSNKSITIMTQQCTCYRYMMNLVSAHFLLQFKAECLAFGTDIYF